MTNQTAEQRILPMSLELFERECQNLIRSIPNDDPLADHDTRTFAENALVLVREYMDYRQSSVSECQRLGALLENVSLAAEGEPVSEFLLSFWPVRAVADLHERAEAAEARAASLEDYVEHYVNCAVARWSEVGVFHAPRPDCTCGLSALLSPAPAPSRGEDQ